MHNIQLVSDRSHKDIRIISRRGAELGDSIMHVQTFPAEFRFAQADYPILYRQDSQTGSFSAVVLFGLEENENLFLDESGWNATYLPLMIQRQPFHIGIQPGASGADDQVRVLQINMDSPRVSKVEGERLFLDQGGATEYLNYISSMLETIHEWNLDAADFYKCLDDNALLEPVSFSITLQNGRQAQLLGFYGINEDALANLDTDLLDSLNKSGYLAAIYMSIASVANMQRLIKLKNKKEASKN